LAKFINGLVDEEAPILINQQQTRQEEKIYLGEAIERVDKKLRVQYLSFYEEKLVANCQVDKGRFREERVGTFGISVVKEHRGDGIGFQLARQVIDEARKKLGIYLVQLNVYAGNEKALGLYRKLGFIEYGRLPRAIAYKQRFVDRVHMYLALE